MSRTNDRDNSGTRAVVAPEGNYEGDIASLRSHVKWIFWLIGVLMTLIAAVIMWYIPRESESAAKLAVAPLSERVATLDTKLTDIEGRLDRIQNALAGRGAVDAAALHQQFDKVKAEVESALAAKKPGKPADIREVKDGIASALVNVRMPADVQEQGVSALVHVAAYDYFTQAFPSHSADLIMHNFHIVGGGIAIQVGPGSSAIADGGRIVNSGQDLAGIYWIRTTFENSEIRYSGGPLYLADVTFKDCTFKFGNDPRSREVKAALLGVTKRNKPVTMLLAGNFSSLRLRAAQ